MDLETQRKWDAAAATYDLVNGFGPELRWGPVKRRLFGAMRGRILFVGIGSGQDVQFFPAGRDIAAIDISGKMIAKAEPRAAAYDGRLELRQVDVHDLDYADQTFDQAFSSCTFCSVPDPVHGLEQIRRVLKPGGALHMFEHTGSRYFPFNVILDVMTPICRRIGPELNRKTVENVERAGFSVVSVDHVYLDVVNAIHAVKGP